MENRATKTQEAELHENGYFLYQGYHFKPLRQFTEQEDFFTITRHLKHDIELGMRETNCNGHQKRPYSHDQFYEASTDKTADIFLCFENQKQYVPCSCELQEYIQ